MWWETVKHGSERREGETPSTYSTSFPELLGGTRELSKIFFDKIPVKKVSPEIEVKFNNLVSELQKRFDDQKTKDIDNMIFDIYSISTKERTEIGYIEIQ